MGKETNHGKHKDSLEVHSTESSGSSSNRGVTKSESADSRGGSGNRRGSRDAARIGSGSRVLERWFRIPRLSIDFLSADYIKIIGAYILQPHEEYIVDQADLESATNAAPQMCCYNDHVDMYDIAACYGFYLSKSHSFFTGNKRAAALAVMIFLQKNGGWHHWPARTLATYMEVVVTGDLTVKGLAHLLREGVGSR